MTHYRIMEHFRARVCGCVTNWTYPLDRVHMALITHPLVGDPVYGGRPRPQKVLRKHLSPRCVSLTARRYMQPCVFIAISGIE